MIRNILTVNFTYQISKIEIKGENELLKIREEIKSLKTIMEIKE